MSENSLFKPYTRLKQQESAHVCFENAAAAWLWESTTRAPIHSVATSLEPVPMATALLILRNHTILQESWSSSATSVESHARERCSEYSPSTSTSNVSPAKVRYIYAKGYPIGNKVI
ncbi:hypothetical protein DNTS_034373 [Danionella cerebrum]|uniref:Uncharacterized protein n=1 Tax=Danionella cerebrum TaxID=2873325 RepID=A0A553MZY9_9TELE|nr:hypothetical protein DNTS_034373 [Danionella translucida]